MSSEESSARTSPLTSIMLSSAHFLPFLRFSSSSRSMLVSSFHLRTSCSNPPSLDSPISEDYGYAHCTPDYSRSPLPRLSSRTAAECRCFLLVLVVLDSALLHLCRYQLHFRNPLSNTRLPTHSIPRKHQPSARGGAQHSRKHYRAFPIYGIVKALRNHDVSCKGTALKNSVSSFQGIDRPRTANTAVCFKVASNVRTKIRYGFKSRTCKM